MKYRRGSILTLYIFLSLFYILLTGAASASSSPVLTAEERKWLDEHKSLLVSGPQAFPPFQFFDESGQYVGIAADYLNYIAKQLDITIEYLPKTPWPKILKLIQHKEIDVLSCATYTDERNEYLLFSQPHLTFPLVIITRKDGPAISQMDDIQGMRIALVEKISTQSDLDKRNIHYTPQFVSSPTKALQAVALNKADIAIENLAAASYIIEKEGLTNLKIATSTNFEGYALSIAIRKDWPIFLNIINKSLAAMSDEQHRQIRQQWITVRYEHGITFIDIIKYIALSLLLASLIIGAFLLWNRRLIREIEERKLAEMRMKESERKLSTAIGNIPGMVYRCSNKPGWPMEFISDGSLQVTGYLPSEIDKDASLQYGEIIHPEDQQHVWDTVQKQIGNKQPFELEYRIISKLGETKWVWEKGGLVIDAHTKDIYLEGFISDITEQKKVEEKLRQSQKMEAIGTLAGGIAHDFNNILAAILGYAELAKGDSPPESKVAKNLDKVLEGGERAKDLVQQILAFSRHDELKRIPLQPVSVVKKAIKILRPSLPTTIEINLNITSETSLILADPTQVHQILMNLCTNAFHAMEETGGNLGISLKEVTLSTEDLVYEPNVEAGTFVQLSVSDSGPGIAPDVKAKIFEPYFTTKETGKGTGMGLAIVHGIVKSYGGFISLYSEPGEGTVFHVFLPVIKKKMVPEVDDAEPIPVGRDRILFIDDEEILAEMGKSMLEWLGYDVTVRNNSIDALETFKNQPERFDLVITDQTMPGMTGADIARRMIQIRPDIPIILCTGYSAVISEEKAKSLGIKEFALKPLSKRDIAVLIRKVLDSS